jgi:nucleotide-binding universal stress UspA family protein
MERDIVTYRKALEDFKRARSKAAMQRFWAGVKGESLDLLQFDEISAKLHAVNKSGKVLKSVPLNKIIGSVGRTSDFDRSFLPLSDADEHRWANVKTHMISPVTKGLPPVDLYKIGEAYFVLDGNHRVSVAKQAGFEEIEAYVTEIKTKVAIDSNLTAEELIRKAAYADFLEATRLDEYIPGVDFTLNKISNYELLKEHISVHRYYMGLDAGNPIDEKEATLHWYDQVYLPVVAVISDSGLQWVMKDLTLTDLYLWVLDQQTHLQETLDMPVSTENALEYSVSLEGKTLRPPTEKLGQVVDETLQDAEDETKVKPLQECMFRDILVGLSDADENLDAVWQAIFVNRCQDGNIRGLHVLQGIEAGEQNRKDLEDRFYAILDEARMRGKFLTVEGTVSKTVAIQSLLSDLLVLKLNFPMTGSWMNRLSHGIPAILRLGKRPILIVKGPARPLNDLLLLYDGSLKSKEGLFISAYFAAAFGSRLSILSMNTPGIKLDKQVNEGKRYLDKHNIAYRYFAEEGKNLAERVNSLVSELNISMVICGGYNGTGLLDRIIGTDVDEILNKVNVPVLICQ